MPATKDQVGRGRRRIVAQRLREFFTALLARLSAGSAELFDKAEQATEEPTDKKPPWFGLLPGVDQFDARSTGWP